MIKVTKNGSSFVGYEYKEVTVPAERVSMYIDGYCNFGWVIDENFSVHKVSEDQRYEKAGQGKTKIGLKRDRKIMNKMELTRLQQHFEACMNEIELLEESKRSFAVRMAVTIGILGTVFMALSTFAVTHEPPLVIACILLAIPGFIGWGSSYFAYQTLLRARIAKVTPIIENKYEEAYQICEKGNRLLLK